MKKLYLIPLAIILILGLILSSCGGKTPARNLRLLAKA